MIDLFKRYINCQKLETAGFYKMDLQLFAGDDKTEPATPKRKADARKKGQILRSPEISSAIILTVGFLSMKIFGGYIKENILLFTQKTFSEYIRANEMFDMATLSAFFLDVITVFAKVTVPIIGTILVAGIAVNYAQVGFLFTTETIMFNIDKLINPMTGLKKMFSAKAFADLIKSLVKITIVGYVAYQYISGQIDNMMSIMDMDTVEILSYFGQLVFNVGIRIGITFIILGLFDYLFQWWQYERDLRMSKQEIKDEYKEAEGNPQVKAKIREKQRAMSIRRMMQEVPKADVIITNPTHFAIAVKYDASVSSAPIVVAKGKDFIAQRIKEIARENKVEIVENRPLARTLYDTVDIGESIPPELYQAVAEILAFVFSLREGRR